MMIALDRTKAVLYALLASSLSATSSYSDEKASQPPRPNFIFVLGEGRGWASMSVESDASNPASKSEIFQTPTLEKLAGEGMRFSNFYAPSPRCTPSRVAYMTGKSPAQLHMTFTSNRGSPNERLLEPIPSLEMPLDEVTIAELLKPAGYASAHFGKWHMGRMHPSKHGFSESDGPTSNGGPDNSRNPNPKQAYEITKRGIDFMTRQVAQGKPFYLQISHYGGRSAADALRSTFETIRESGVRDERGAGAAAVALDMDITIRLLLAKANELRISDRTYIIYTADHGTPGRHGPLQGGKGGLWEGGIRVPLIIRGPGIAAGHCSSVRTTGVDLLPTIAELAGVESGVPTTVEGGSLVSVLKNRGKRTVQRPREELVFHFPHYDKDRLGPVSAILKGNYKLMRVYESETRLLFDLSQDLGETRNLATAMPEKVSELDEKLSDYLDSVKAQLPNKNLRFGAADLQQPRNANRNRRRSRRDPVTAVLDTNQDGELSTVEIRNAPVSIRQLDKNNDGKVTADELRTESARP